MAFRQEILQILQIIIFLTEITEITEMNSLFQIDNAVKGGWYAEVSADRSMM